MVGCRRVVVWSVDTGWSWSIEIEMHTVGYIEVVDIPTTSIVWVEPFN